MLLVSVGLLGGCGRRDSRGDRRGTVGTYRVVCTGKMHTKTVLDSTPI